MVCAPEGNRANNMKHSSQPRRLDLLAFGQHVPRRIEWLAVARSETALRLVAVKPIVFLPEAIKPDSIEKAPLVLKRLRLPIPGLPT